MKLVRVSWFDTIEHPTGWYEASDIKDLEDAPLVHSYGLILKQNEKTITLIADLIPSDNTFGRGTTIPRGMIKEIKDISIID